MGRARGAARMAALALSVLTVVLLWGNDAAWAADEDPGSEAGFRSLINRERSARGLGTLLPADDLAAVARRHSARMASQNEIFHNPNLASEVDNWQLLGENVGTGATVQEIHDAFMDSKVHRDVILHPRFTEIGVGVLRVGDALWVTEVFRQPEARPDPSPPATVTPGSTAAPPVTATAAPATRTAPAPAAAAAGPRVAGRPLQRSGQAGPGPTTDIPPSALVSSEAGRFRSFGPLAVAKSRPSLAALPLRLTLPLPEPAGIPGLGLVATALLLAVVGAASKIVARPIIRTPLLARDRHPL